MCASILTLFLNERRMNPTIQLDEERPGSILPYVCWVVVLAVGFMDLVYVREVFVSMMVVIEMDKKLFLLVDKVGFFFFGVAGLLIILLTEPYLRIGWRKHLLEVRFWKILAVEFASLSVLWAIMLALPGLADHARPPLGQFSILAALLVVSAALFFRAFQKVSSQRS
jgi:hypothetical protein